MTAIPDIPLNDGTTIPQLGFGVFQVDDEGAHSAVATAIDAGYRLIDTARVYRNERGTGRAIAECGVARDELYVTTKVWNSDQGFDETLRAFDASMDRLGLARLDLYLIHWPVPSRDRYVDTFRALVRLREEGRLRSVGVSNFQPDHLRRVIDDTGVTPVLNQVEVHPYLQQPDLLEVHRQLGVVTEAWSPLGQGKGLLDDPALARIAARHGVSPAQVVLRWHLDRGCVAIPKSVTPSRIVENLDVFGFELTDADASEIGELDRGERVGPDPDRFTGE